MKIIKTNREIFLEFRTDSNSIIRMEFPSNQQLIMSDGQVVNTQQLYGMNSVTVVRDLINHPKRYKNHNLTNKKLLSIREGGAGDLLFKTPIFKHFKETYSNCSIGLACSPTYHSLFTTNPYISTIYPHVFPLAEFEKYDYFSTFEGVIENNKEAEYVNAYDLYIDRYGLDPKSFGDKTPILVVPEIIKEYWKNVLSQSLLGEKKIGYQWRASSPARTLPFSISGEIIRKLTSLGYKVFIIDSLNRKNDVAKFIADCKLNVVDTSPFSDNFIRMAGIISLMDIYVGPDSSGTHIAASLGKPIVGLYGAFRSELRLKYYKNAVGIDVIADKCGRGCYQHSYDLCSFAKELGEKASPCWHLLDINLVVNEVDKLYKKVYSKLE